MFVIYDPIQTSSAAEVRIEAVVMLEQHVCLLAGVSILLFEEWSLSNQCKNIFSPNLTSTDEINHGSEKKEGLRRVTQRLCLSIHPFFSYYIYLSRVMGGRTVAYSSSHLQAGGRNKPCIGCKSMTWACDINHHCFYY